MKFFTKQHPFCEDEQKRPGNTRSQICAKALPEKVDVGDRVPAGGELFQRFTASLPKVNWRSFLGPSLKRHANDSTGDLKGFSYSAQSTAFADQSPKKHSKGLSIDWLRCDVASGVNSSNARHVLPSKIGRYQVRCLLGQGGEAAVYQGWDDRVQREVAITVGASRPSTTVFFDKDRD